MDKITSYRGVDFRQWTDQDSLEDLTRLLNRAYMPLKERGMNYLAATQDASVTQNRIAKAAYTLIGLQEGRMVATLSLYAPRPNDICDWYNQDHVSVVGQFAVHPDLQKQGIGVHMMALMEDQARTLAGVKELSLDTSEHAHHLIAFYKKMGYRQVATTDWPGTNYMSVVLSKAL